jgi:integrase
MTTPNILPTEWHKKPRATAKPCPICGFWQRTGTHRALVPNEDLTGVLHGPVPNDSPYRWLLQRYNAAGVAYCVGVGEKPEAKKRGRKPGTAVPPQRVAGRMGKVIAMIAHGKSVADAAKAVGLTHAAVFYWKQHFSETWAALTDRAQESAAVAIRAMAGTDRVLEDPDKYMAIAQCVDKWATAKGIELFPVADGELTLCRFYRDWYLPNRLGDAREKTRWAYATVLRHWRLLTGDPSVKEITTTTLSRFRDALSKMRGKKRHLPMSPNSVSTYMKHLQVLLDKLGPPGQHNRDALDILARVPWTKPPRVVERIPRTITLQQLSDCIAASVAMEVPRISGVKAPAWWRSLLLVAWNTGLRIGTLLSMRMDEIDWRQNRLLLAAARMKSRRPLIVPLNASALAALQSIRTERELVFPWPSPDRRAFWRYLQKLEDAAGIPKSERFGMHAIRKTVATMLYEVSPGAAQFALGHTTNDVTRKSYVDGGALVARALDQLPQPEAFPTRPKPKGDAAA